jgi:hypothetical protein
MTGRAAPRGALVATLDLATGYGEAGAEYARALHRVGVPIRWSPMVKLDGRWRHRFDASLEGSFPGQGALDADYDEELLSLLNRPVERDVLLVHAPYEWWDRCRDQAPGARVVVFTTWETDRLPVAWRDALNRHDLVLVPSEFNRRAFAGSGVHAPMAVVPHAARRVRPASKARLPRIAPDDFVFYTIGEWRARKNLEGTVRAYLDAFTADEPVALVVKTSDVDYDALDRWRRSRTPDVPPSSTAAWWTLANILAEYPRAAKVHLIAGRVPRRMIDELHARGDCFVSLTRGEGWGLGAFEAGLFDKPSIITGWSGHVEYLGADYPLLVRHELVDVPTVGSGGPGTGGEPAARWASPDRKHASELMRSAFDNAAAMRVVGASLGARLRDEYRTERVGGALSRALGFGDGVGRSPSV